MLDPIALRAETPAAQAHTHLNNASSSLMPASVVNAMQRWLLLEAELGHHGAVESHQDEVDRVDQHVTELLGCDQPVEYFDTVGRTFSLMRCGPERRRCTGCPLRFTLLAGTAGHQRNRGAPWPRGAS